MFIFCPQDDGKTLPVSVSVGDKVMLPEYGGTKVLIEDQVLVLNVTLQ